jgi:hypothetical protein
VPPPQSVLAITLLVSTAAWAAPAPTWVQESNADAQPLLETIGRFTPERAAVLGVEGYDDKTIDLQPQLYERYQAALRAAEETVKGKLQTAREPSVKQDLQLMIDYAERELTHGKLEHDLLLPYVSAARVAFGGIRGLIDPRIPKARQAAALVRLRRYAGVEPGSTPLTELVKARTTERFGEKQLLGPYRPQVQQDLADSARLGAGIEKLLRDSGFSGWEQPLDALRKQLEEYDGWVRKEILPRSRSDNRLPPALYADNLRQVGVNIPPEEVIRRALVSFAELRNEMNALAPLVAKQQGLRGSDYREVLRALKRKQLAGPASLGLYRKRLAAIEDILRREQIITVPDRAAIIRLATEAESTIQPAPNMSAPRLIGNTGEYGEFVLPLATPGRQGEADLKTDDFTYDAATWTLTAHEARPGHELQFSAMIEKGVSIARAVFAFNSVNVEGWALYAEAEVKPYAPLDGQLVGLQFRLLRAARAFVDPMVNLGELTPEQARQVLLQDVVLSEGFAKEEVDRFTYRRPGQATSYFIGYQAMMETRQRAQLALGPAFDRKRFHDFVLSEGLLPPELLQKAVLEQFVPAERTRTAGSTTGKTGAVK